MVVDHCSSKEVEMVESMDDLKSSRSTRGTPGSDFELLDARIASALCKIIQNTRFKKEVQDEGKKSSTDEMPPRPGRRSWLVGWKLHGRSGCGIVFKVRQRKNG